MKKSLYLALVFVLSFATVHAELPQQYTAVQTIESAGTTMTNTVYVDMGKMRIEADMNGMKMITIVRPDKNLTYQLMPGNIYMELPFGNAQMDPADFFNDTAVAREDVGTETIDGVATKKQKVVSDGKPYYLWVNAETDAPVKVEAEDGSYKIAWKSVTVGPQQAELFEIPAGYQKADTAALQNPAMMQNIMSSMTSQGQGAMPQMQMPSLPAGMPAIPATPTAPTTPPTP